MASAKSSPNSTSKTRLSSGTGLPAKTADPKAMTQVAYDGRTATEPPYSDAEHYRMQEVCETLYGPTGAHANGKRIHNGPLELRAALPADAERFSWVHSDKQYSPYIVFSKETPLEGKSAGPKKMWMPKELHDAKKKGVKGSGPKYAYTEKDIKAGHKKLAARPRWDTEHHVMVSQANEEVQTYVREYFDKPIRKESEGVPKVRELYSMNDRQMGWWDEPSPLGEPKHTYLDNCVPWNVGGPKEGQKVSYWRKVIEKSASMPVIKEKITDSRSHLSLTERLADMPAAQATQFWREWADCSKNRLPQKQEEKQRGKKGKHGKRGGWPSPTADAQAADETINPAATVPVMPSRSSEQKGEREDWNNRWSVCVSKDNTDLCMGHRQFFSSAQFLSGAETGHPGAYLGLESQKWRNNAKHIGDKCTPGGAQSRGPIGRRCMLY